MSHKQYHDFKYVNYNYTKFEKLTEYANQWFKFNYVKKPKKTQPRCLYTCSAYYRTCKFCKQQSIVKTMNN